MAQSSGRGRNREQEQGQPGEGAGPHPHEGSPSAVGGLREAGADHASAGALGPYVIPADHLDVDIEELESLIIDSAELIREFNGFLDADEESVGGEIPEEGPFADKTRARARAYFDRSSALLNRLAVHNGESGANPVDLESGEIFVAEDALSMVQFEALEVSYRFMPRALPAMAAADPGAIAREVFFKLCGALGVADAYAVILEYFETHYPNLLRELGEAVQRRQWKKVKKLFARILRILRRSAHFRRFLVRRLGAKFAARVIGKILAKFVPVLGWALLIGNLIAVLIVEAFY